MKNMFTLKKRIMLILVTVLLIYVVQGITYAQGKGKIYWSEWGKIRRANFGGSAVEDVVPNLFLPKDITLDLRNGKMYWIDTGTTKIEGTTIGTATIQRANLNGSNIKDIITGLTLPPEGGRAIRECVHGVCKVKLFPKGQDHPVEIDPELQIEPRCIAVDGETNRIYWGNLSPRNIQRANLDGTDIENLFPRRVADAGIWDIKLDLKAGKMYWVGLASKTIRRANLDGTDIEDIVIRWPTTIVGLALDVHTHQIYWSNPNRGTIKRASFNGDNVEDFVTGLNSPEEIVLDPQSQKIYWASWDRETKMHKIQRANLDGTNVTDILTGLKSVSGIALDIEGVYDVTPDTNKLTTTWANVKIQ